MELRYVKLIARSFQTAATGSCAPPGVHVTSPIRARRVVARRRLPGETCRPTRDLLFGDFALTAPIVRRCRGNAIVQPWSVPRWSLPLCRIAALPDALRANPGAPEAVPHHWYEAVPKE